MPNENWKKEMTVSQKDVYDLAAEQGFYPCGYKLSDGIAGAHAELSEAYEAYRHGDADKFAEELADTVMYCMGMAERIGKNLFKAIEEKHIKNMERGYLHGKDHI